MSDRVPNIEGKIVCDSCGYPNEPNARECIKCKGKRFAPYWVVAKIPINRQVSVDITTSNPTYGPIQKRITLSKWWPGDNTSFHVPTLRQWRSIKRIIDKEYMPLLGWEAIKGYEPETKLPELPADIQGLDLSDKDIKKLFKLLPILIEYDVKKVIDLKRLIGARKVLHYMRLENVLKEFERRLKTKASEHEWQKFFKKNLLILNPGYMEIIEKPNISLEIKLPDFLLLNIEGYVDIYEVKIPETALLKYDTGRKNFYWSSDIAKSIAQVENYIDSIDKNRDSLILKIKEEYDLDLKVVRPRGYIIAGRSRELKEPSKYDDFRLLNESLKSTEILTFDIFLERFKSFSKTLKEAT